MLAPASLPLASITTQPVDTLLRPADLEAYAHELPIAAMVLPRLQAMLLSADTSIHDLVDLVMIDPGLAARVIQAASSPVYGSGQPAATLAEALKRLGADEVYRVTTAFALRRLLNRPLRCYGLGPTEFWRRSIACALAMVDLAPASGLDERVAYTVGLLHALGMVFIDRHLRCVGAPNLRFGPMPASSLPKAEVMLTGMNHARAAAFVLRTWYFSEAIVEPIEHQFNPSSSLRHRAMTSLLAEASSVAAELAAKLPPMGQELSLPLLELLGDEWRVSLAEQILVIEGHQF
jgi:HD-like signal output (HDOD) protein